MLIASLVCISSAYALPECPSETQAHWHNCHGTYSWNNNNYVGEFRNDKKHGFGTLTFSNGDVYVGEFSDGGMRYGTYRFANGAVYLGEFSDGKFNGFGELNSPN